jgi:tRNA (adenine37-N6)-methyltransferase
MQPIGNRHAIATHDPAAVPVREISTMSNASSLGAKPLRSGEIALAADPASMAGDAHVVFIGRIWSTWAARKDCPKNPREARERGQPSVLAAALEIDPAYRPGLQGLAGFSHAIVLYWMHQAQRDLIVQNPAHATEPRGVFSIRSPVRPNPIALAVVRLGAINPSTGHVEIDAIDCVDGTPLIDIKPYLPSVDAVPSAGVR